MKSKGLLKRVFLTLLFFALVVNLPALKASNDSFYPIKYVMDSLPNGLHVIYNIDKTAPIIATVVHYRVGSHNETPGKTGYAHFFEHLMFEATSAYPRASIDKNVQEASGTLNAHTYFDETVYYIQLPSNELKLALWIESQRMRHLLVDTIGVETQRGVVLEELKMHVDNQPYGDMIDKLCANLWNNSNYQWSVIGSKEDLAKATIDDFRTFYNKFYHPSNAVLVISGDFELNEARKYVNEYFGQYKEFVPVPETKFTPPPLEKGYTETITDEKAQLPAIFISYRAPKIGSEDYYAFALLVDILSSGESSRLYSKLVDEEQIAVNASIESMPLEYSGAAMFIGIPTPGNELKDISKEFSKVIESVIQKGVTTEELDKAKNITAMSFVSDKKNVLSKAESLAMYFSYFRDPSLINSELDKYLSVTVEDIKRVAKKYFDTDKRVVLNYLPKTN